jgi:hypothetical protein
MAVMLAGSREQGSDIICEMVRQEGAAPKGSAGPTGRRNPSRRRGAPRSRGSTSRRPGPCDARPRGSPYGAKPASAISVSRVLEASSDALAHFARPLSPTPCSADDRKARQRGLRPAHSALLPSARQRSEQGDCAPVQRTAARAATGGIVML